jgi:hypothetical protein
VLSQQLRQLGDIRRNLPGLIFAEQLGCGTALVGAFFNRG